MEAAAWSPRGRNIAYFLGMPNQDSDGRKLSLWLARADGTHQRRLITFKSNDAFGIRISFTPHGQQLMFSYRDIANGGTIRSDIVNRDGSDLRKLPYDCPVPSLSHDGKWVACDLYNGHGITKESSHGAHVIRLTRSGGWPSWSPGDRRIVYQRGQETRPRGAGMLYSIWMMRADGSHKRRILPRSPGGGSYTWPSFSPDGKRLVFFKGGLLFTSRIDGTHQRQITVAPRYASEIDGPPIWQPEN